MFTGIVQQVSEVQSVSRNAGSMVVSIDLGALSHEVGTGDSVLVDGVCLTAVSFSGTTVSFDLAEETAKRTTLKHLTPGECVNVELAMQPSDRFGGHFVSGHVDGCGEVVKMEAGAGEVRMRVKAPAPLAAMMIPKGSVAVNGISLTIAALNDDWFEVSLVPHTMRATTLDTLPVGGKVNIECDMIGKWVKKLLYSDSDSTRAENEGLTMEKLQDKLGGVGG